jgi:hypothetical protein
MVMTAAVALLAVLTVTPTASAAPLATIDTREPALEDADDGSSSVPLALTNLTAEEVDLTVEPADTRPGCALTPSLSKLPPTQLSTVTVAVPAACKAKDGITITVNLAGKSGNQQTFTVNPAAKPSVEPLDWQQLWAFPVALVASILLSWLLYMYWSIGNSKATGLFQPLDGLGSTWSFKDNWVTNVTTVGALLTGIFGTSSVVKAFLGEEAEASIALATVGGAIALAFVAAGPIVLLATKSYKDVGEPPKRGDAFTVFGLLLSAATVLASAFGQLWVVRATGANLDMAGLEDWLWVPFGAATLLLIVYTFRVLPDLLARGAEKPAAAPSVMDAAVLIATVLKSKDDIKSADVEAAVEEVREEFPTAEDAPPQAEYSALI